jgi:hypothetical protein
MYVRPFDAANHHQGGLSILENRVHGELDGLPMDHTFDDFRHVGFLLIDVSVPPSSGKARWLRELPRLPNRTAIRTKSGHDHSIERPNLIPLGKYQ